MTLLALVLAAQLQTAIDGPSCVLVRWYVRSYGVQRAMEWAAEHGYSRERVAEIRRQCKV